MTPSDEWPGRWTTLSAIEQNPVQVGRLNIPHPDNKYARLPALYRKILKAQPEIVDSQGCPTTGPHLHHIVRENRDLTVTTTAATITKVPSFDDGDCVSREVPMAKLSSGSSPAVASTAPPKTMCPPLGLKLTKVGHESLSAGFTLNTGNTLNVVRAEIYQARTETGFCHPDDKATCTPLKTVDASAAGDLSITFDREQMMARIGVGVRLATLSRRCPLDLYADSDGLSFVPALLFEDADPTGILTSAPGVGPAPGPKYSPATAPPTACVPSPVFAPSAASSPRSTHRA